MDAAIDLDAVQRRFESAVEHLREYEQALARASSEEEAHVRAYSAFEEALAAAGYARALGRDEVDEYLGRAADAAARLFRLNPPIRELEDLDSEESELFVDTSATNPWTFVRGAYAAVASGNEAARATLGEVEAEDVTSDQVEALPSLERYSAALGHVIGGRLDEAREALGHDAEDADGDADDRFWRAQDAALRGLLAGDEDGFRSAMGEVVAAFEAVYDRGADPERLLALPILGLEALGRELLAGG